jgi:hypothetical protein
MKRSGSSSMVSMGWVAVAVALAVVALVAQMAQAKKIVVSPEQRAAYIAQARTLLPDQEPLIAARDMFNGPPNPYGLVTHQTLECDFVEPDPADPIGGTTPKFTCAIDYKGDKVALKIKYDQQYNQMYDWGRPNEEVYASVISQRILWGIGFGADQSVPVRVNCRNCPMEPWTYIQAVQGYAQEDTLSGWLDVKLLNSGMWNTTLPLVTLDAAVVSLKLDDYMDGDAITYLDENGVQLMGFGWPEIYSNPSLDSSETVARDALSVVAAFISHCDNFDGNQGFICLDTYGSKTDIAQNGKDKTECDGQPLLYIHDVGGTLGYGWNLKHLNFWPNYMDLKQWEELSVWGDLNTCSVQVNGLPGCSWTKNLQVSEDGRALAARLLAEFSDMQITDLFTAARANLMRNDTLADWISGFKYKMQRDVLGTKCSSD